jgi:hypothetical protein
MMKNDVLDAIKSELSQYGINSRLSNGGKHLRLDWTVETCDGRKIDQMYTVAKTSSDWRAPRNAAHKVRTMLKDVGAVSSSERAVRLAAAKERQFDRIFDMPVASDELRKRVDKLELRLAEQTAQVDYLLAQMAKLKGALSG